MSKILPAILGAAMASGGGSSSQVQSDWNENNTTSDAYIQNRPFYEETDDEIYTLSFTDSGYEYNEQTAGDKQVHDYMNENEAFYPTLIERLSLLSDLYDEGYDGTKTFKLIYGNTEVDAYIKKSIFENQSIQFNIYKVGEDYDDFWHGISNLGIFYEVFSQETDEYKYDDIAIYDDVYDENIKELTIVISSSTIYKLDNKFIDKAENITNTNKIATAGLVKDYTDKLPLGSDITTYYEADNDSYCTVLKARIIKALNHNHEYPTGIILDKIYDANMRMQTPVFVNQIIKNLFPDYVLFTMTTGYGICDETTRTNYGIAYKARYSVKFEFYCSRTQYDNYNVTELYKNSSLTTPITVFGTSNGVIKSFDILNGSQTIKSGTPLGTTNTSTYTPTNDYNPATKKYVDDSIAAIPTGGALVITSSASTVVEGKAVPKITNTQLTSIYNAIVTEGKTVYIEDSDSEQRFEVTGAETDGTHIFAYMVFAESLLLTYQDSTGTDATITGKAIGGGSSKTIDDTHIPIYYAGEIYFNTNSNPWTISKTSEDGIKILNKINEAYHNNDLIFYLQVNNTNFDLPYRNIKILIKLNPTGGTYEKFVPKGYQLYTDISSSDCRRDFVGLPGIGRWQLDENDNWTTTEYYILSRSHTVYNFAKGDVIKYVYSSNSTTTIGTDVIPTISDTDIGTLYDRFTSTSTKYDCYVQDSLDFTTSRVLEASLISGAKSISFIFAHRLLLTYTVGATPEVLHLGGTQ